MKVAYLGPPGTFSEEAALRWLEKSPACGELVPDGLIPDVLSAVEDCKVDYSVVPVENSIEGTVGLTLDYLTASQNLVVVGEVVLPVEHNLAVYAPEGSVSLSEVRYVYSHPQALSQCKGFLGEKLPRSELRQASSTAEAASVVAAQKSASAAAICSAFAAQKYNLTIVAFNIQDYPNNKTRFFVVGKSELRAPKFDQPGKTSLVFSLPEDRPGGLYLILKDFAEANINLTKIESRPAKQELGQYLFYLDCEGYAWEEAVAAIISGLKSKTVFLKVLGSYPRAV